MAPRFIIPAVLLFGTSCFAETPPAPGNRPETRTEPLSVRDYAGLLDSLLDRKVPLPRLKNNRSGVDFNRIVDVTNLTSLHDKAIPFGVRMESALELSEISKKLFMLYSRELEVDKSIGPETSRVMIFQLAVMSEMLGLMDEFFPTIKKDAQYQVRIEGLKKMGAGLAEVITGTFIITFDGNFQKTPDFAETVEGIRKYYPSFKGFMRTKDHQGLLKIVDEALLRTSEDTREPLVRLRATMESAPGDKFETRRNEGDAKKTDDADKPTLVMHRQNVSNPDKTGWQFAESTSGSFSVMMPVPFNDFMVISKDTRGKSLTLHIIGGKTYDKDRLDPVSYTATAYDRKEDVTLESIESGFKPTMIGTPVRTKDAGSESSAFEVKNSRSHAWIRIHVTPERFFMAIAECPAKEAARIAPVATSFVTSLKTKDGASAKK